MELNIFNETSLPRKYRQSSTLPKISFTAVGLVYFNKAAVDLLKLEVNQKIAIANDKKHPQDWYVFKSEKDGYALKQESDKKAMKFSHASLIAKFCETVGKPTKQTHTFLIGGTPTIQNDTTYWGILVKN